MIWANLTGVFAMAIAVAAGWANKLWLQPHVPVSHDITIQFAAFCAGCTALLLDRYSQPGFFRGYLEAVDWFFACPSPAYASRKQRKVDPRCRLAFFALPVAFAPFYVLLATLLVWGIDHFSGAGAIDRKDYRGFLEPLLVLLVVWVVLAAATESRRRIPGPTDDCQAGTK